ncbi:MAG: hypothetical protein IH899_20040 [Planctomycetes bacterium]|nr:hypothetical protein [Planctomycetota bacterium]
MQKVIDAARQAVWAKQPDEFFGPMKSDSGCPEAIQAKPLPGGAPQLSARQLENLRQRLLEGAQAHGFSTDSPDTFGSSVSHYDSTSSHLHETPLSI